MLTGKQKRFLRGMGHSLKAIVTIGKGEINEPLINETVEALNAHELIKVKMLESCLLGRTEAAAELAQASGAEVAQILGRTFLLYKKADKPTIELPTEKAAKKPAPKR